MAGLNTLYFSNISRCCCRHSAEAVQLSGSCANALVCLRFLFGEYLRLHKFFCYVQCILQLKTMSASYGQSGN